MFSPWAPPPPQTGSSRTHAGGQAPPQVGDERHWRRRRRRCSRSTRNPHHTRTRRRTTHVCGRSVGAMSRRPVWLTVHARGPPYGSDTHVPRSTRLCSSYKGHSRIRRSRARAHTGRGVTSTARARSRRCHSRFRRAVLIRSPRARLRGSARATTSGSGGPSYLCGAPSAAQAACSASSSPTSTAVGVPASEWERP